MNLDPILKDIPGKTLNKIGEKAVRTLVECLECDFTTAQSHISKVTPDYDRGCVSVVFTTPYVETYPGRQKYFADLLRMSDAVAFDVVGSGDDMTASLIFTIHVWDE